jgi:hypothetical protein
MQSPSILYIVDFVFALFLLKTDISDNCMCDVKVKHIGLNSTLGYGG